MAQQKALQGVDVVCTHCGSAYLRRVAVTKYKAGGYGTVSIQEDTDAQQFDVLICLCGYPVSPKPEVGRRAGGIREQGQKEFFASVEKAQDFLDSTTPEQVTAILKDSVAGKFVEGRVEDLTDRFNALEAKTAKPAHEAHEKKSGNSKSTNDPSTD